MRLHLILITFFLHKYLTLLPGNITCFASWSFHFSSHQFYGTLCITAAASAEEAAALAEEAVGAVFDDHDDNPGNFEADDEIALAAAAAGKSQDFYYN